MTPLLYDPFTPLQLAAYLAFLKTKINSKNIELEYIEQYWREGSDQKYTFSDKERKNISKFLNLLPLDKIIQAIDIASSKIEESNNRFRYLCGVLNNWIKENDRPQEVTEIIKYWNYKRPQVWKKADEGKVLHLINKYDVIKIKYYIDRIVDEESGWADFDTLIDALISEKYD